MVVGTVAVVFCSLCRELLLWMVTAIFWVFLLQPWARGHLPFIPGAHWRCLLVIVNGHIIIGLLIIIRSFKKPLVWALLWWCSWKLAIFFKQSSCILECSECYASQLKAEELSLSISLHAMPTDTLKKNNLFVSLNWLTLGLNWLHCLSDSPCSVGPWSTATDNRNIMTARSYMAC